MTTSGALRLGRSGCQPGRCFAITCTRSEQRPRLPLGCLMMRMLTGDSGGQASWLRDLCYILSPAGPQSPHPHSKEFRQEDFKVSSHPSPSFFFFL